MRALALCLLLGALAGCAGGAFLSAGSPQPPEIQDEIIAREQRLTSPELGELGPESTADDVRERLGPPLREYARFPGNVETWEYRIASFPHPGTLYIEFSPERRVKNLYVIERRAARLLS